MFLAVSHGKKYTLYYNPYILTNMCNKEYLHLLCTVFNSTHVFETHRLQTQSLKNSDFKL